MTAYNWHMPGFFKLIWFACHYMCVCVRVSAPKTLITSDVIWCDIDHVWLIKQVLQLFPAFSCFIWQLPSIKWMGVALVTQHILNACQRRLKSRGTSYRRTTLKTEHFSYKGEREMCINAFKRTISSSFTVIILA